MEAANIMLLQSAGIMPANRNLPQFSSFEDNKIEGNKSFEEVFQQQTSTEPVPVSEQSQPAAAAKSEQGSASEQQVSEQDKTDSAENRIHGKRGEDESEIKDRDSKTGSNLRITNSKMKKEISPKSLTEGNEKSVKGKDIKSRVISAVQGNNGDKKNVTPASEKTASRDSDLHMSVTGSSGNEINDKVNTNVQAMGITEVVKDAPNKVTMTLKLQDEGTGEQAADKGVIKLFTGNGQHRERLQAENKNSKKFVLIDGRKNRAGGKNTGKEGSAKNGTQGISKSARRLETQHIRTGESEGFKIVQEEILDSSEKIIRLNGESQGEQVGRQPEAQAVKHANTAQLTRHLAEQGNRQIVKQTGIILKNDNSGEIRLILKPESMGNVRIQLQLQDNTITGKILVDNSAVKYAFDQNLDELYEAFKEAGFEEAQLDVQVGGENKKREQDGKGFDSGLALHKIEMIEEQIPLIREDESADTLINLVV